MAETDSIIVDTTTRIFQDLCDPQTINNAGDESWKRPLWTALEEAGLTRAWVPEALGGAEIGIADTFEILTVGGRFAVPVPLAETLLAGWLLSQAGIPVPEGQLTVAPARDDERFDLGADDRVSGTARRVPFAREAGHIAVLARRGDVPAVALLRAEDCRITPGASIAGEPRDDVTCDGTAAAAVAAAPDWLRVDQVMLMGAAMRAAQMSGALEAILETSVAYAREREAFGRPISKFQAVQHNLAKLAGETAAALAAAGSAADTLAERERLDEVVFLEIAAAKVRVGEAAGAGAAIAHQVHGAIGFTKEHVLHRFTQRLWAWRDDFGNESAWAVRLGNVVAAEGADALWPMLAAR